MKLTTYIKLSVSVSLEIALFVYFFPACCFASVIICLNVEPCYASYSCFEFSRNYRNNARYEVFCSRSGLKSIHDLCIVILNFGQHALFCYVTVITNSQTHHIIVSEILLLTCNRYMFQPISGQTNTKYIKDGLQLSVIII